MRIIRIGIAGLVCSVALTGCATALKQTSTRVVASMRVDEQPSEERRPEGWRPTTSHGPSATLLAPAP